MTRRGRLEGASGSGSRPGARPGREPPGGRRRAGQGGFTLIELLAVISILGILAAIAVMGLVGLTAIADGNAKETELRTVQRALDGMIAGQRVTPEEACPLREADAPATRNMRQFPTENTAPETGQPVALHPNYLRQDHTSRPYRCVTDTENKARVKAS